MKKEKKNHVLYQLFLNSLENVEEKINLYLCYPQQTLDSSRPAICRAEALEVITFHKKMHTDKQEHHLV